VRVGVRGLGRRNALVPLLAGNNIKDSYSYVGVAFLSHCTWTNLPLETQNASTRGNHNILYSDLR